MDYYALLRKLRPIELGQAVKWLLRPKRIRFEAEGCLFLVDPLSNFGGNLLTHSTYEPDLTNIVKQLLGPGDTFIDVGANEGWYSVIAARIVGPSGSIIAVEPQERCWPAIHRNFVLNRMWNYRLVPYAIGDYEGEIDIVLYPSLNGEASTLVSQRRSRRFARQKTKVIRLDSVTSELNLSSIKLIKIDCEGYELNALRGAEDLLRRGRINHLLVELHPRQLHELGQRESDVADYLRSFKYDSSISGSITLWTHGSSKT
jgi:FkbM family methyltransferase